MIFKHRKIRNLIELSVSGDVSEREAEQIRLHVETCKSCEAEHISAQKFHARLSKNDETPEIDIWFEVRREILSEAPKAAAPARLWFGLQFAYGFSAIAATLIVYLMIGKGLDPIVNAPRLLYTGTILREAYVNGEPATAQIIETSNGITMILFQ